MKKLNGFTIAEVLIVLGIIGTVSALTIPGLVKTVEEQETVAAVKKAYSTFSQAYSMAMTNGGLTLSGTAYSADGAITIASNFDPYFNIAQSCGTGTGCFPDVMYKYINGNNSANINSRESNAKYRLTNGSSILFESYGSDCSRNVGSGRLASVCGAMGVDINGEKGPNTYGRDYFIFWITKTGILPVGTKNETTYPIASHCSNKSGYGIACAAWVVLRGNTKYLKGAIAW